MQQICVSVKISAKICIEKQLPVTAVTRNCCFSVSCSSFFPIFVFGNGEISVAKPQLRVAAKRYKLVAENFFSEKFSAHWSLLIGINKLDSF